MFYKFIETRIFVSNNGIYEAIGIYWIGPNFTRGYGAIYFQDGNIVSSSCLNGYELKKKYVGKYESDESGNQSGEVTDESNESKHVYKALNDIIGNYEGSTTCSKKRMC